jgi:hypothetical protein
MIQQTVERIAENYIRDQGVAIPLTDCLIAKYSENTFSHLNGPLPTTAPLRFPRSIMEIIESHSSIYTLDMKWLG